MNKFVKYVLAAISSLTLTGCQPGCRVKVSGSAEALVIELIDGMPFYSGAPPISSLMIKAMDADRPAWEFHAPSNGCRPLKKLNYGELPQGFVADHGPVALKIGMTYEISVFGCGRTGGTWFRVGSQQVEEVPNPSQ